MRITPEIREKIKTIVKYNPEGISLTEICFKLNNSINRLKVRSLLFNLYTLKEIGRERVVESKIRITKYFPYSGKEVIKRKQNEKIIKKTE